MRLDDKVYTVKRQEYNWNMWFIAIGGFERSMKKLFGLFVTGVTNTSYTNSILGALFMMKQHRPKKDDDKDDKGGFGGKKEEKEDSSASDPESKNYRYSNDNKAKGYAKKQKDEAEAAIKATKN